MDLKTFNEILNKYNIKSLLEEQFSNLNIYSNLLKEWTEKINLTAITENKDILLKHFLDSMLSLPYIADNSKIIDIGTGGGFPSLPLKIANDSLKFTLVDSVNKKLDFVRTLTSNLKLKNVEIVHSRCEDLAKNTKYRESFDVCVSRAVASLNTLSEYCLPFIKVGGSFIAYKSQNTDEELEKAMSAIKTLGGEVKQVINFHISETDSQRTLVIIRKVKKSPFMYPRGQNKPRKTPL